MAENPNSWLAKLRGFWHGVSLLRIVIYEAVHGYIAGMAGFFLGTVFKTNKWACLIWAAIGGVLPDIDHPISGGRTFFHGSPAAVGAVAVMIIGLVIWRKIPYLGLVLTFLGLGFEIHLLVDALNIGV